MRRIKYTYANGAMCHQCGKPFKFENGFRSLRWAYKMLGVRWVLCSKECQDADRDNTD